MCFVPLSSAVSVKVCVFSKGGSLKMFSYPPPLSKDHKILEHEYCSGYTDNFGKWNTGFYCPQTDSVTAVFCCETPTFKYCCTIREEDEGDIHEPTPFFIRTPVIVGIIAGITLVLLFITVASCFFCSCCFVYKKRRAHLTGGLYRMQCSSSTASGLVNMYSPSSTSNHNSLVTTPLDTEWSVQGQGGVGQNHTSSLNPHDHLMALASGANGHGNGYPPSILSSGFPHNNNCNQTTLPRYYQSFPPPQQNNLPPPVFYPENNLDAGGVPYSLTASSNNAANFPNSTRQHQQQRQQINYPIPGLSTGTLNQNQRIASILRALNTNCIRPNPSNSSPPQANSYAPVRPGVNYRPTPEIVTSATPQEMQICTLPRRNTNALSTASTSSSASINALPKPIEGNGGESRNVSDTPGPSVLTPSELQECNRLRSNDGPTAACHSNLQRLTSCLSSSDSQHQALNASSL